MSDTVAIANAFIDAANAKQVERLVGYLHEDVVMDTVMGVQTGRDEARAGFETMLKMGGGAIDPAEMTDAGVKAHAQGPMGKMTMSFAFRDDQISALTVKQGAYK
ncbi:MAG: nuclear transport factor 2 family protein [Caulobacterales bacterium]|nr:nuclear transport factor 2 family protein [Caulobacterales bacterium]